MFSVIIPVYKNEDSIDRLLSALTELSTQMTLPLEVVFVVDGSPDRSFELLKKQLSQLKFSAQLLLHSRNFGSFAAIRTGLSNAKGDYFGVMAADLQEPPELMTMFAKILQLNECDVVIGTRSTRADSVFNRLSSNLFWGFYRRYVVKDMPSGGGDVFGCNKIFRNQLLALEESRSSLIALIFWLGFRRELVSYDRLARLEGSSSWTFRKKIDYMLDSIYAFSDAPISMLIRFGVIGCGISVALMVMTFLAYFFGSIRVPGYTPTVLLVLFFGALNMVGLGIVGTYAWRAYENTKARPLAIVAQKMDNVDDKK